MVRHYNWHDPSVLKRVRIRITISIWLITAIIIYLQHERILSLLQQFI
ncbi:MAG: hypothetical protein QM731_03895 [Chitinophagaceae bacterium]